MTHHHDSCRRLGPVRKHGLGLEGRLRQALMIEETAQAADLIRQIDLMILRDGGLCQQLTVVCLMVMEEAAFTVKTSHQGGCPIELQ